MTHRGWAAAGLALLLAGCVGPSPDDADYAKKAAHTAQAAVSELRTAGLTADAVLRGRAFTAYADQVLSSSEDTLSAVSDTFASVQPPTPASDELRDQLTGLLSRADDALGAARIAQRRDDLAGLRAAVHDLRTVAGALDQLQERLG